MLRGKRMMCLFGLSLLVNTYNIDASTPFLSATQVLEKQVDIKVVHTNNLGLIKHPIFVQFEKDKEELEKKKAEEQIKLEQNQKEPEWQEFIVSFYTGLDEENYDGCGGRNCLNKPLEKGMIANNVLPLGTKIFLDNDYGIRTVEDKGSSNFNSSNRIDLYVARWDGETREQWKKRANSYGVKKIRGYIIK